MAAPQNYAIVIFPGFQALDAFGPIDALNCLSRRTKINFSIIARTLDPVPTGSPSPADNPFNSNCSQSIVPTHTFDSLPYDGKIDVLLVPGGMGTRHEESILPVIDFLGKIYPSLGYLVTVCTGSEVFARTGLLDGRRATTNKMRFESVEALRPQVEWVRKARWVVDGNIWTSSGISAGIDVTLAFFEKHYGRERALEIARVLEYEWHQDADRDPFYRPAE
ncbi:hypothetical protein FQN54_001471 [Arachnomyces sp. PD_36]|nr:hypothetical protein FQN54_001471 [Arachnomyces sp. PD_36]